MPTPPDIDVIAPNLKRRLSGVTSTIVRLVPVQAREIDIVTTGPGLPEDLPHIPISWVATLPRTRWRVWHARRNTEMLAGVLLRHVLRRRFKLLFTSAAQRRHSGYTRWLIGRMDALIATSERSASFLDHAAKVIHHGIDLQAFAPARDKATLRAELGLPNGPLVGMFGRIREQKGSDVFVAAMLSVMAQRPDAHALIIGQVTPKERAFGQALQARIADAGMAGRFTFVDYLAWDDLVRYYRALDLFVAASRVEGFGLTPLEAMASGVPAIATPAGAYAEQIVDGETGRIVPAGDSAALALALTDALNDPARLKVWGQAGRARVEQHFSIEREASEINAVYCALLQDGT
ncbi:MAG: glycosyltransferase family 4 protein [Pseudomonadota bacterium]